MSTLLIDLRHAMHTWTAGEREEHILRRSGWTIRRITSDAERHNALTAGAEALWTWSISADEAAQCPGLQWISTPAAGADYLPVAALQKLGITVTVSHQHHGPAMAEHALGMILSLARSLNCGPQWARAGEWWRDRLDQQVIDLMGADVVIIGYGAIAQSLAPRLQACGCSVTGLNRSTQANDAHDVRRLGPEHHDAALQQADIIVNILPHIPATDQWLNKQRIASLKEQCIFINIGRGETVDQEALCARAQAGSIRLGLDVFASEPLPADHILRHLPNVLCTPHAAAFTNAYLERAATIQAKQMQRFDAGAALLWQIGTQDRSESTRML